MIKRILIPLDPDKDTPTAVRYAAAIAKRTGASLTGLAVMDTDGIAISSYGGSIGTIHYAERLRENLTDETSREAKKLLSNFTAIAEETGVIYHTAILEEGSPHEWIVEDSKYHDLVLMGRESHFFYGHEEEETKTLSKVVKNTIAPTMVVGPSYREINKILVAFDGSAAAARTLQWYVQLQPFGKDTVMELVMVNSKGSASDKDESMRVLRLAEDVLNIHGYGNTKCVLLEKGSPGENILEHQESMNADLILLGAHSMAAIRRITVGSTTHFLLNESTVPLFMYH